MVSEQNVIERKLSYTIRSIRNKEFAAASNGHRHHDGCPGHAGRTLYHSLYAARYADGHAVFVFAVADTAIESSTLSLDQLSGLKDDLEILLASATERAVTLSQENNALTEWGESNKTDLSIMVCKQDYLCTV